MSDRNNFVKLVEERWYIGFMTTIIALTAGEIPNKIDPWSPITYGQSRTYSDAIIQAGGVPIVLPLTTKNSALRIMYDSVSGILLAGGNDVDPRLYGEDPGSTTKDISTFRDEFEIQLIKWAMIDKKPILAICRGMQLLNVACGGSLYQNISTDIIDADDHNVSTSLKDIEHLAHVLQIKPGSQLAETLGLNSLQTNTHHHQAIKTVAPTLEAVAWSSDGVIEAIEGRLDDAYLIGVQSHPESLVERAEKDWLFVEASAQFSLKSRLY
jgi:putative glutamine amidotransferase